MLDQESRNKIKLKESKENVFGEVSSMLNEIKENLCNDGTNESIQLLKRKTTKVG